MAVPLQYAQGLAGMEKSLSVREQRFPNTALALGWRLALITYVCVSFLRVIQHDSVGKQEQPLKHRGAFSLQRYWCWGGRRGEFHWLRRTFQKRPPLFTQQPHLFSHRGPRSHSPPPPPALHPTKSSDPCKYSSICQQKEGACYFCYYLFCYFSVISTIITAGSRLPVCRKAD